VGIQLKDIGDKMTDCDKACNASMPKALLNLPLCAMPNYELIGNRANVLPDNLVVHINLPFHW
jgi:hypothetical protein